MTPGKGRLRWTLIALLGLICLNALAAAYGFIADPDGSSVGIPQEWLEDTPFKDYLIPGLLLGGLGLLHGWAAVRVWLGRADAWVWAGLSGSGLIVWILVQALLMGSTRHPIQTLLQAACLLIGAATGILALLQMRRTQAGQFPPEAPRLVLLADDSQPQMREIEAAVARLAKQLGAQVAVVVVGPKVLEGADAQDEVLFGRAVADPHGTAMAIKQRFQDLGLEVEVLVKRGPVAQAIGQAETELAPDVLAFGRSGRQHLEYAGSPGVLDQVKNEVSASVLVVQNPPWDVVAAAIDGSEPSLKAAHVAGVWSRALRVPLVVLLGEGAALPKALRGASSQPVTGPAGNFLLDWSRSHPRSLLVLGSRGLGQPGPLRMGSVSDRVSWGAGCSVLVVRAR